MSRPRSRWCRPRSASSRQRGPRHRARRCRRCPSTREAASGYLRRGSSDTGTSCCRSRRSVVPSRQAAQVGHQEHGLDHTAGDELLVDVHARDPALGVHDGQRGTPAPAAQVTLGPSDRGLDPGSPAAGSPIALEALVRCSPRRPGSPTSAWSPRRVEARSPLENRPAGRPTFVTRFTSLVGSVWWAPGWRHGPPPPGEEVPLPPGSEHQWTLAPRATADHAGGRARSRPSPGRAGAAARGSSPDRRRAPAPPRGAACLRS